MPDVRNCYIPLARRLAEGDPALSAFFRFSERGTNFRTEVVAGLTTFVTMAYIIFVNPAILGTQVTGLPVSGVFFATCVAAAVACIAMGLVANFPLALAFVWPALQGLVS
jgi:adenine/guanine/hypoxanthine permease